VVNDFGAINIDAELVRGASEGVVSLRNGCICCLLQGDLLRTLSTILRRDPRPDGVVIEASGVSDIVRSLLDPTIWRSTPLDAVVCPVDARQILDEPQLATDPLYRSQIAAGDFVVLNKIDLLREPECEEARMRVAAAAPRARQFACAFGRIPPELLFGAGARQPWSVATQSFPPHRPPGSRPSTGSRTHHCRCLGSRRLSARSNRCWCGPKASCCSMNIPISRCSSTLLAGERRWAWRRRRRRARRP
jgi:G3E family GTPase